jgi:hypothetical protein
VALTELIDLAAVCPQLTFDYTPNSSGWTNDSEGVTALFGRTVALDHRPSTLAPESLTDLVARCLVRDCGQTGGEVDPVLVRSRDVPRKHPHVDVSDAKSAKYYTCKTRASPSCHVSGAGVGATAAAAAGRASAGAGHAGLSGLEFLGCLGCFCFLACRIRGRDVGRC